MDSYRWRVVATERRWRRRLSLKRFWSTRFPVAIVAQRAIVTLGPFSLSLSLFFFLRFSFSASPFPSFFIFLHLLHSYSWRELTQLNWQENRSSLSISISRTRILLLDSRRFTIKLIITNERLLSRETGNTCTLYPTITHSLNLTFLKSRLTVQTTVRKIVLCENDRDVVR